MSALACSGRLSDRRHNRKSFSLNIARYSVEEVKPEVFSKRKRERLPWIVVCQVVRGALTSDVRAYSSWDGGIVLERRARCQDKFVTDQYRER